MRRNHVSKKISRRQFLIGTGVVLAGLAAGCGQRKLSPTTGPSPSLSSTGSPRSTTVSITAVPSPTPMAAAANLTGPADMVFVKGKVITVDAADKIVQAVAVKDGLIQLVGADQAVNALVGEKTRVVNLAGRALTPGLIDAHNHFQLMGLMNGYYQPFLPPDVKSIKELQAKLAEIVAQTPAGDWIQGYYLSLSEGRPPNRQELDVVSPRHPVWIMQQGGHYGVANTVAIQIAKITASTPNPEGGIIERDAKGEPTGVFYNHRAMDMLRRYAPAYTPEMVRENIASTQPIYAACGVTSFQDNNVRGVDNVSTYLEAGKLGTMYLRGAVYYTLEWPEDLKRALDEVERYSDPYMRFAGFKFLLDGQAPTAYCHEPHNGISWNMPTWESENFKETVRALHDTGLQICVHCVGDAAVDLTLDAYEAAMNANPRPDPRHRIEHCILCTPEAVRRMKDLGVVVSAQPQFLRGGGDYWPTIFGAERSRRAIVTREWLDLGVALALGSDAPTTPWYTPQVTLAGAVSRLTMANKAFEPAQCLTIQEALRAHTMGSAYAGHEENSKGSIEKGKLADLIVWHADPYQANLQQLVNATIDMTLVGGKVVYEGG